MARRTDITRLVIKPYPRETAQASYLSLRRVLWKTCVYPPPSLARRFAVANPSLDALHVIIAGIS